MKAEVPIPYTRTAAQPNPLDSSISDAEVAWLRSREPFASINAKSYPRGNPLDAILKRECRICRCEPGQIVARQGDYGSSAFLVLAGSVRVMLDRLAPPELGRRPAKRWSWSQSLKRSLFRSGTPERREPDEISINGQPEALVQLRDVDNRPAVFLQDFNAVIRRHRHVELGPGELFGEVAAMFRSPRSATVIAQTEATLLEIRWQGLRQLRRDPNFARHLEDHYRKHWLISHLREVPLLRQLPQARLAQVAAAAQLHSFGSHEWQDQYSVSRQSTLAEQLAREPIVCSEGRIPTELILIRQGFARVSRQQGDTHITTAYLGKGQLFGLEEIAYNTLRSANAAPRPLQHSLRAVGILDVVAIPAESFAEEVLPHVHRSELPPSIAAMLLQSPQEREHQVIGSNRESTLLRQFPQVGRTRRQPEEPKPLTVDLLQFLIQHRLNNGRQAMVIDLKHCTECNKCVAACEAAHDGNARFERAGVSFEQLQFTQACMHCTDPVCMIGCPTGAISRDEATGNIAIEEPLCIGCGICASNCPYDSIRMVTVRDGQGDAYRDEKTSEPIKKATKCDSCSHLSSGPACVRACPNNALIRIDLTTPQPLSHWLDSRRS